MTVPIFLSHDVDYSIKGPREEHILSIKERFPKHYFDDWLVNRESLYCNIAEVVRIEEELDVRSTFFFRPYYETGSLEDYAEIISELVSGGWEVGLHVNDWRDVTRELKMLQAITPHTICGTRCHYLKYDIEMYSVLKKMGIKYDSSIMVGKIKPCINDTKTMNCEGITIFPITIAECYLFAYQNTNEGNIVTKFKESLEMTKEKGNIMTAVWHDSSLKMYGGRMYQKVLEYLVSQDTNIMPGIQAYATNKC